MGSSGVDEIVLANATTELAEYEASGGYAALPKARGMTPQEITEAASTLH